MVSEIQLQLAEFRGEKPSMEIPVLFAGWGGEYMVDAIFKVCPEYIGNRKVVLFFDSNYLVRNNRGVQSSVGSGFTVDAILPEFKDEKDAVESDRDGIIIMHPDPTKVKEAILFGKKWRNTKEFGGEYSIAFYCYGEFDLTITAVDDNHNVEVLYKRSFCCE